MLWFIMLLSTNPWLTNCIWKGIAYCCCILWLPIWFNLSITWCKTLILQLAKDPHTKPEPPPCFQWVWYRGLQLFHQLFAAHRPSYLTQRFQTLIHQFKRLYSVTLLSSLSAPWPTGAFHVVLLLRKWFLGNNSDI